MGKVVRKEFQNKTILVTGGTGSIGLGLIKQLIKREIKKFYNQFKIFVLFFLFFFKNQLN